MVCHAASGPQAPGIGYALTLAPASRGPAFKHASCNSVKTHRPMSALMLKCVGGWE